MNPFNVVGLLLASLVSARIFNQNPDTLFLAENIAVLQSKNGYNLIDTSINNVNTKLLFDLTTPILWHRSNDKIEDPGQFILNYTNTAINGLFAANNSVVFAGDISLNDQFLGSVNDSVYSKSGFGSIEDITGIFGHSYYNPILKSLNSTRSVSASMLINGTNSEKIVNEAHKNELLLVVFGDNDNVIINNKVVGVDENPGCVIYGGLDSNSLIDNNIFFTSVVASSNYYWLIGVSAVYFSNSTLSSQLTFANAVQLDNGASISTDSRVAVFNLADNNKLNSTVPVLLMVPYKDADVINSQFGGSYNGDKARFQIPCEQTSILQLDIGGNRWNITSEKYIYRDHDTCYSNIVPYLDQDNHTTFQLTMFDSHKIIYSDYWVLGSSFLEDINVILDIETHSVGLSSRGKLNRTYNIYTDDNVLKETLSSNATLLHQFERLDFNETDNSTDFTISSIYTTSLPLSYSSVTTVVESKIVFPPLASSSQTSHSRNEGDSLQIVVACGLLGTLITYLLT